MPERVTRQTLLVLDALLAAHRAKRWTWGFELCADTGLKTGTIYPVLARLENEGWVRARWDEDDRPGARRRLYQLTPSGAIAAGRLVTERVPAGGTLSWRPA